MKTTHALFFLDNSTGDKDRHWIFAYLKDGEFFHSETDNKVLEYIGDEILKEVNLHV